MASVLFYVLPVLLTFVLMPKQSESETVKGTENVKESIVEELADVSNNGQGQKHRPDKEERKHGHRHRHAGSRLENARNDNSDTSQELTAADMKSAGTLEETKVDEGREFIADNDDTRNDPENLVNNNKKEEFDSDRNNQEESNVNFNEEIIDNNDEIIDNYDEVTDYGDEMIDNDDEMTDNDYETVDNDDEVTDNGDEIIDSDDERINNDDTTYGDPVDIVDDTPFTNSRNIDQEVSIEKKSITEKEIKIEMFKQHLLQKLGLSTAPEVDSPLPPLPFDFYVGEDFAMNDDAKKEKEETIKSVKTREIFVFGKDITEKCAKKKSTGCYSFNTTSPGIDPNLVSGIELWIYKQPDVNDHHIQEFMVSELEPYIKGGKKVLRFRNIVKRIETRLKYGWMKIYVRRSVIRWLSKPHRNHGLAVVCKTCQRKNHKTIYGIKEGFTPILVFYMKQHAPSHKRNRRHARCIEGGLNCCHKEELVINFRDIGWNYIMAPETIRTNYCTGSCNGIQAAYFNHTRLMQTLRQSVLHNFASIQTCCSPVSFARPQSLLYMDHFGNAQKTDVPDLIVGECGCT